MFRYNRRHKQSYKGARRFKRYARKFFGNKRRGRRTAYHALRIAKKVASVFNVEYKYKDSFLTPTNLPAAGYLVGLTSVAQGDSGSTRDGDSIKLRHINFNYTLSMHGSATTTSIRVIFFIDKLNASSPTTNSTVSGDDYSVLSTTSVLAQKKRENNTRYVIIYDKVFVLDANLKRFIKLNFSKRFNLPLKWKPTATSDVSPYINSVNMLIVHNEPTNLPVISWDLRKQWIDN